MGVHLHPYSINHLHNAECIKCLGKGGFGDVKLYKCNDQHNVSDNVSSDVNCTCNKYFVVKKFLNKKNKSIKKYLLNEYTIGSLLHHNYIRETLDVDLTDNSLIFEYCPGIDFFDYLHTFPSFDDNLFYFKQLIEGVEYMHKTGIAHMDLKLENILINLDTKTIKIIDFGESRVFHDSTHINTVVTDTGVHGSTPYIAPEEFEEKEYNPEKIDIWAISIILYELVYHSLPWQKADKTNIRYKMFLDSFLFKNKLNDRIFYKKYNPYLDTILEIFKESFNPDPNKRCNITFIKNKLLLL